MINENKWNLLSTEKKNCRDKILYFTIESAVLIAFDLSINQNFLITIQLTFWSFEVWSKNCQVLLQVFFSFIISFSVFTLNYVLSLQTFFHRKSFFRMSLRFGIEKPVVCNILEARLLLDWITIIWVCWITNTIHYIA